jgi:hypothetical protein
MRACHGIDEVLDEGGTVELGHSLAFLLGRFPSIDCQGVVNDQMTDLAYNADEESSAAQSVTHNTAHPSAQYSIKGRKAALHDTIQLH